MKLGEGLAVHLGGGLQRVAPVGEEGRLVAQDHGCASRTGEAGHPGQALGPGRDIFSLMLVAAGHHETVDAAAGQFGA